MLSSLSLSLLLSQEEEALSHVHEILNRIDLNVLIKYDGSSSATSSQSASQQHPFMRVFDYIFGAYLFDIQHLNELTRTHARIYVHTHTFAIKNYFDGILF